QSCACLNGPPRYDGSLSRLATGRKDRNDRNPAGSSLALVPEKFMTAEQMTTDVRALLDREPFDAAAVVDLREGLGRDPSRYRTLRDAAAAMHERHKGAMKPEIHLRLGVAEVLMGRFVSGLDHLAKVGDNGLAHYFSGLALENLQRWNDAADAFAAAAK